MAHEALAMTEYGDKPCLLLFADSDAALARGRRSAELAGCRIADASPIAGAAERLDRQIAADAVLVEVDSDAAGLDPLLERLEAAARCGRHRSVVSAPFDLIDAVAARAAHCDIVHLCDPSESERVAALALATMRPAARLHDIGKSEIAGVLQQISEEIARIAKRIASVPAPQPPAAGGRGAAASGRGGGGGLPEAALIHALLEARRERDKHFEPGLFADPAWDILLDLMLARIEKRRVAVSSACIAAAVPSTTALRWITRLTDLGLIVRSADPQDGRRVYVELSDKAVMAMSRYFAALGGDAPKGG